MGEIDFSKKIIKILDANVMHMIMKKAMTKGFTVQGFTKNVWLAPKLSICAALGQKKRGKYQSSIFLEALNETEIDDVIVSLSKKWLQDKDARDEIEKRIEQIQLEKTKEKKIENIIESSNSQENLIKERDDDYEDQIQQLKIKNKKLQNTIQDLKIGIENSQKEIVKFQKENMRLEKQIAKKIYEQNKLENEISNLQGNIRHLEGMIHLYEQEKENYQEIFKRAPKVLCFSKRDINQEKFPFYKIKQLHKWLDEYIDTIKWNEYKEIWVIETDFNYSEVIKMKRLPCKKIVLTYNVKSLIEKVGGFDNEYAK